MMDVLMFASPVLAANAWVASLLVVGFLFICIVMILTVLIQKPQGGGLSGAFGAGMASSGQTAFGARTGDALTIATILIFLVYLGVAIGLNYAVKPPGVPPTPVAGPAPGVVDDGAEAPATTPTAPPADVPIEVPPLMPEQPEPDDSGENEAPGEQDDADDDQ